VNVSVFTVHVWHMLGVLYDVYCMCRVQLTYKQMVWYGILEFNVPLTYKQIKLNVICFRRLLMHGFDL